MSFLASLEICGGIFCLICIFMLTAMRGYGSGRAKLLVALFAACSVWCFLSSAADMLEGNGTDRAYYPVRVVFFAVWFMYFVQTALTALYIREIMNEDLNQLPDDKAASALRERIGYGMYISLGICAVGVFLLIISQIFNIFYYFDNNNSYVRYTPSIVPELVPVISAVYFLALTAPLFRHIRKESKVAVVYSFTAIAGAFLLGSFFRKIPFALFASLTICLFFFTGCIRDCLNDVRIKEEAIIRKDAAIAEQRARIMQSQIRPHFIFNSLLAIKQLCLEEPRRASEALQHFSTFLRANLEALTDEKPVPISREIECIKEYVALEQSDPSGRFLVNYDISFEDFKVPLLSVEPMVENAIRHGVASKKSGGVVTIRTFKEGDKAVVTVEDNGSGYGSETAQQAKHRSVGIQNVRDRLSLICGGELSIVNTGNGTIVRITVPCEPGGDIS